MFVAVWIWHGRALMLMQYAGAKEPPKNKHILWCKVTMMELSGRLYLSERWREISVMNVNSSLTYCLLAGSAVNRVGQAVGVIQ